VIIPIVKTSEDAAKKFNEPIELIFIDGAHDYELVKLDFELWFPKVIYGGIMAFHDTTGWPGPRKVVKEFIYKSKYFKDIRMVDSITFAKKVRQNTKPSFIMYLRIYAIFYYYYVKEKLNEALITLKSGLKKLKDQV
jgi:hypothetical protein